MALKDVKISLETVHGGGIPNTWTNMYLRCDKWTDVHWERDEDEVVTLHINEFVLELEADRVSIKETGIDG